MPRGVCMHVSMHMFMCVRMLVCESEWGPVFVCECVCVCVCEREREREREKRERERERERES